MSKKIFGGIVLLVVVGILAVWGIRSWKRTPLLPPPIATGTFTDGSKIELLQVTTGRIQHAVHQPTVMHRDQTRSFAANGNPGVSTQTNMVTHEVDGIGMETLLPDPLLIEFRWTNPAGVLLRPERVQNQSWVVRTMGSSGSLEQCPSAQDMMAMVAKEEDCPEILVQMADGQGGWLNVDGPVVSPEDPHALCFGIMAAWPRSQAELKLRFIIYGKPPLEFTVPNPRVVAVTPSAEKPAALPAEFKHPEFAVRLRKVESFPIRENFPLVSPEVHFEDQRGKGWFWHWKLTEAEDESGNRVFIDAAYRRRGEIAEGFLLSPVGNLVRIRGQVHPTSAYPRKVSECTIVGEGVLDPSGVLALSKTAAAEELGVTHLSSAPLGSNEVVDMVSMALAGQDVKDRVLPGDRAITPQAFEITVDGELNQQQARQAEAKHGAILKWQIVVFLDDEGESDGVIAFRRSSTSVGAAKLGKLDRQSSEYSQTYGWGGRIVPGQRVRVGLVAPKPPVDVEFVVERPQVTAP